MPTKRQRRKRRRRQSSPGRAPVPATAPAAPPRRRGPDDRPTAPWGSFPLTEIAIFIALVVLVAGFFVSPPQGFVMIAVGLAIGSLAGLELSIREHFAAYRSHTLVLAAAVGVPLFGVLFVATRLSPAICIAAGLLAFGGAAWLFASAFRRRSGGALYRVRG
jgi:hypothetical protein